MLAERTKLIREREILTFMLGVGKHKFKGLKEALQLYRHAESSPLKGTDVISVFDLLDLHDTLFLNKAYETMLQRKADPAGSAYYVARLRTGYSKISILDQLSKSPEAHPSWSAVAGLREKLDEYRARRGSLRGLWLRRYDPEFGMAPRLRSARAIENAVARGRQEVLAACDQLRAEAEILRGIVSTLMEARPAMTGSVVQQGDAARKFHARSIADVREFDLPEIGRKVLSALSV